MNESCKNDACKNGTCQHDACQHDACKSKSSDNDACKSDACKRGTCKHDACKDNDCKVDRKLPPHELNARRNRKRMVTHLPGVAHLPAARHHKPSHSPNDSVYNPATNQVNNR